MGSPSGAVVIGCGGVSEVVRRYCQHAGMHSHAPPLYHMQPTNGLDVEDRSAAAPDPAMAAPDAAAALPPPADEAAGDRGPDAAEVLDAGYSFCLRAPAKAC